MFKAPARSWSALNRKEQPGNPACASMGSGLACRPLGPGRVLPGGPAGGTAADAQRAQRALRQRDARQATHSRVHLAHGTAINACSHNIASSRAAAPLPSHHVCVHGKSTHPSPACKQVLCPLQDGQHADCRALQPCLMHSGMVRCLSACAESSIKHLEKGLRQPWAVGRAPPALVLPLPA